MPLMTSQKCVLASKTNWDLWLNTTASLAEFWGCWKLVDPNLNTELKLLEELSYSQSIAVNLKAVDIANLTASQQNMYSLYIRCYKEQAHLYKEQKTALEKFNMHLHKTVSNNILTCLNTSPHPSIWSIMCSLQFQYCPPIKKHLNKVLDNYKSLKWGSEGQDHCVWIERWWDIKKKFERAQAIELNTLIDHFMNANSLVNKVYTTTWRDWVEAEEVNLEKLIDTFYNNY